jgi:hypothetical protein
MPDARELTEVAESSQWQSHGRVATFAIVAIKPVDRGTPDQHYVLSSRAQSGLRHWTERGEQTMITGGCHCGAIRYQAEGEALTHALCHCTDCRRHAGAPMVGWTMYPQGAVKVTKGTPKVYLSSDHGRRHFCPDCGTGLFYTNAEILPEIIDIQSATYDDPDAVPARAHIQVADRIGWMARVHELPAFERYPPPA